MKKLVLFTLALLVSIGLSTKSFAQGNPVKTIVEVQSKAVEKTRGANPNIKSKAPATDQPVQVKSKSKNAEAAGCEIEFENTTTNFVEVYIDGDYSGTVGPAGRLILKSEWGYTKVYCITTGQTKEWSFDGNCKGNYLWKLN